MAADHSEAVRAKYLRELHQVLISRSIWLFRSFLREWSVLLGPLGAILEAKSDDDLARFMEDVAHAMQASSNNQLASQFCAPWLLPRKNLESGWEGDGRRKR